MAKIVYIVKHIRLFHFHVGHYTPTGRWILNSKRSTLKSAELHAKHLNARPELCPTYEYPLKTPTDSGNCTSREKDTHPPNDD